MKCWRDFIVLYVVTFAVLLPLICFRLEYSIYHYIDLKNMTDYHKRVTNMNDTSNARLHWAEAYLRRPELQEELVNRHERSSQEKGTPSVMLTIITTSRKHGKDYDPRYVIQVVGKLLQLMFEYNQRKHKQTHPWRGTKAGLRLSLALCNVDAEPRQHSALDKLAKLIPTFTKYGRFAGDSMGSNLLEKEKLDFIFCLRQSLKPSSSDGFTADYVLLLEDDAYPLDELFPVLDYQIHSHLEQSLDRAFRAKPESTAYVKLYHPRRLQGYISLEPDRLPEAFALGMVFGTVLTLVYRHLRPRAYNMCRTKWVDLSLLVFVVYCALIAFAFGKQNIQQIRRLSKYLYVYVPTPSCCTPAMLFPRQGAERIIEGLSLIHCSNRFGKDKALDQLMRTSNLSAYMVTPSLFEHIGMYSTLNNGRLVDPIVVP